MTQQQKEELNKQLCGLLGINPKILSVMGGMMWEYPDFTSEAGRVQLLKILVKKQLFRDLLNNTYCLDIHLLYLYMTDDNGAFAIAARDFLKAMEGK